MKQLITRARRGLREEMRLYLVAVSSLSVAFLCLGGALLALTNLSAVAQAWGQSSRMTVYLRDGAEAADVAQLRTLVEGLPEVREVEHLSSDEARAQFLEHSDVEAGLAALPAEVFPASLEITLAQDTAAPRTARIAERVAQFRAVSDVETYRGWFSRLESLLHAGRAIAGALALLVGLCVLAVIGNTIRLAVARRREEIEVMKLCGATDDFVRGPFVLEGTFQGFMSALLAVLVLMGGFLIVRDELDATVAALTGVRAAFLHPVALVGLTLGGAAVGAVGSALSLRRYLAV
jgi:cell division transport system permease protein